MEMFGSARRAGFIVAVALITGCSSAAQSEQVVPTSAGSTTTSTTMPVSNLDIRIDPTSPDRANADSIVTALREMERDFPVQPGTVVILYSATDESVAWAKSVADTFSCFRILSEVNIRNNLAHGNECGILMRLDKEPACDEKIFCKTRPMMAAHEFFHVVQYQTLLTGQGFGWNTWLREGAADYVGYAYAYGETPGTLSPSEIDKFRMNLKDLARDPNLEVGLRRLHELINYGPQSGRLPRWYLYLYHKAFLAVTLLAEKFGTDAVLLEYPRRAAETNDFEKAFESTFGITQDDFSNEFESWLKAL